MGAIGGVLSHRNFAFSGTLKRGFLVSPSIYPRVTTDLGTGGRATTLRVNPKVNILAGRLYGTYNGITYVRLSGELFPILSRALNRFSGLRVVRNSTLGVSLGTLVRARFTKVDDIGIYTGLPCCVASPLVVGLLRDGLPVSSVIIVIRGRTTRELYTPVKSERYKTIAITTGCCTRPRVLFRINGRSFVPSPGISDTIVHLGVEGTPPIRITSRTGFFGIIGTTFLRHEGATTGYLSTKLKIPGDRISTTLYRVNQGRGSETRDFAVRRFRTLTHVLPVGWLVGAGTKHFLLTIFHLFQRGVFAFQQV